MWNASRVSSSYARQRKQQSGFTLIELMVVVAIIGVLSSVAIPSVQRFIDRSRESEAPTNIMAIANGAKLYYNQERIDSNGVALPPQFPPSSNSINLVSGYATMPVVEPCKEVKGSPRYLKNSQRWFDNPKQEPWVDLKFSLTESHYFQYGYRANSVGRLATYTVRAQADFNCDTKLLLFMFQARIDRDSGEIIHGEIVSITNTSSGGRGSGGNNNNNNSLPSINPGPGNLPN